MSLRFCEPHGCNNILTLHIKNNELIFQCGTCLKEYPSSVEDTLIYDKNLNEGDTLYDQQGYLRNASKDPLAPLVRKNCANAACKETIVKVISIDKKGASIFICPSCGHMFYNNTPFQATNEMNQ